MTHGGARTTYGLLDGLALANVGLAVALWRDRKPTEGVSAP